MLDTIKDYVSSKRFSVLAFICVIIHFHCGVLFTAVTTALRMTEMENFNCAVNTNYVPYKTFVEKTCFSIYDNTYNSPVRFFAFVMFSFGSVVTVSVIYSLAVGSRIDETERNYTGTDELQTDAKKGNNEPGRKTFYVFNFYIFHLLARSVLGIVLTVLQYTVLYPSGFDKQYSCLYPTAEQPNAYITREKNASVSQSNVPCDISTALDKQFWAKAVSLFNVLVAVLALAEVIYLLPHRFKHFNSRSDVAWSCDSEFIVEYFLRKQYVHEKVKLTGVEYSTSQSRFIYKQKVLKRSLTPDTFSYIGPNTSFDDMFVDIVVQTGLAPHKFSKHMDRHEIYDVYMKLPEHSIRLEKLKDLFYPNKDTKGSFPRSILALGRPGIGKTVSTRKIMHDWANGIDEFYRGKIAFFFKFRWFNFDMLQNITLTKFLQFGTELAEHEFESILEAILNKPQNAILIFDGLDEFGSNLEKFQSFLDESRMFPNDPTCSMSATFFFIKIMFGDLLKGATVLVTSRPTAVDVYSNLNFDRKVEIIGFTSAKIERYVDKFCANHNKADLKPNIWSHITSSSELKNLCYIPVNSFIVCVTLLNCLMENRNHLPTTLTEFYQAALFHFRKYHDRNENRECYETVIKELQQLAFLGMENDQLIFGGKLVNDQMRKSGLLHCLPVPFFQIQPSQVCFIHLTVQEFLAASHIIETMEPEDIKEFISSRVELGKWHLVLQFLAGLLGRKMKMSVQYKDCVLAFAEVLIISNEDEDVVCDLTRSQIVGMKCLRETEDEDIAAETAATSVLKDVTRIANDNSNTLLPSDCAAVVFVCKHLNFLTWLKFQYIENFDCLLEVAKLLQEKCIKALELFGCNLGNSGLQHVLSALINVNCHVNHKHCKLTELDLGKNGISDDGMILLCNFLKHGHGSGLKKIKLRSNKITLCGIPKICEVIEVCNQLTELDLTGNAFGDEGACVLCKTFIEKPIKLRKLRLGRCSLTIACISWLEELLSDEHCEITHLSLAGNNISDKGVCELCCTLGKEQCKLTELEIYGCTLSDECMLSCCEALGHEHCRLTVLNLASNGFTDEHLSILSDTLKLEHCRLKELHIYRNSITKEGKMLLKDTEKSEYCKARGLTIIV